MFLTRNEKTMPKKDQHLKSSIVRTREIIANKLRKLHENQYTQEKKLRKKYAPITDSINKLINTKKNISEEKVHPIHDKNESDIFDYFDDEMKSIPEKSEFDVIKNENNYGLKPKKNAFGSNDVLKAESSKTEDKEKFYERHNIKSESEKFSQTNRLDSSRKKKKLGRKLHRNSIVDVQRNTINELNDSQDEENPKNRIIVKDEDKSKADKQKFYAKHGILDGNEKLNEFNRLISKRVKTNTQRKLNRAKKNDLYRIDFDDKISDDSESLTNENTNNESKKIVISPDDFDEDGFYHGTARKRRKIEVPVKNLQIVPVEEKYRRKRRLKRTQIRTGTGLEKKFIPYAENIVYEYYDNPNELCDRLRLLVSSKSAGNSNHDQEINSIIEELRERHIII